MKVNLIGCMFQWVTLKKINGQVFLYRMSSKLKYPFDYDYLQLNSSFFKKILKLTLIKLSFNPVVSERKDFKNW